MKPKQVPFFCVIIVYIMFFKVHLSKGFKKKEIWSWAIRKLHGWVKALLWIVRLASQNPSTYSGIYEELDVLICLSSMRPKAWRRHGSAFPHLSQPSAAYIINIY